MQEGRGGMAARQYRFGQGVGVQAAGRDDANAGVPTHHAATAAIQMGRHAGDETSAAAGGDCRFFQFQHRVCIGIDADVDDNSMGRGAERSEVPTGVDDAALDATRPQHFDGTIHRMAFGNATEIDPKAPTQLHAVIVVDNDVTPIRIGISPFCAWRRNQPSSCKGSTDRNVKHPIAARRQIERGAQYGGGVGTDRHPCAGIGTMEP